MANPVLLGRDALNSGFKEQSAKCSKFTPRHAQAEKAVLNENQEATMQ
jgi:hypothetical protein